MPAKLQTTIAKIDGIPNQTNAAILQQFSDHLKGAGVSESHHNNSLKAALAFAKHLGPDVTFFDVEKKEQVLSYLDTKMKSAEVDPEKKWITTWNDQLRRLKLFYRWIYNGRGKVGGADEKLWSEWKTPAFIKIRERKAVGKVPIARQKFGSEKNCWLS